MKPGPPSHLKVNVERLHDGPFVLDFNLKPEDLELEDPLFSFPDGPKGEIELKLAGRDIRGTGRMSLSPVSPCARCLTPVTSPLEIPVDETWLFRDPVGPGYKEPPEDEIMAEYYSGDILDLSPALRELVMAALPDLVHCKEDCKGLCQGCGANLNLEPCECARKAPVAAPELKPAEGGGWKEKLRVLKLEP